MSNNLKVAWALVKASLGLQKIRILLVRHAESEGNVDARAYIQKGDSNISITENGCQQALAAGAFLEKYYKTHNIKNWPEIFVSSYTRPQETLRGLYEGGLKNIFHGKPRLKEDVRLIEKFFGAASHLEYADKNDFPEGFLKGLRRLSYDTYQNDSYIASNLFGESTLAAHVRIKSFMDGTLARDIKQGQEEFIILTHGAIIQAMIMAFAHLPMRSKSKLGNPNNCDVIAIEGSSKNWAITKIYDGQAMTPVNYDLTSEIERLTIDTLPPLPKGL